MMLNRRRISRLLVMAVGGIICACVCSAAMISSASPPSSTIQAPAGAGAQDPTLAAEDGKLQSEFLADLVLDKGQAVSAGPKGANRVVVPITGGSFEGPRLKGTVVGPAGDWILLRPDGSSVLDIRVLLQTDDGEKIYVTCRGIAYALPDGALFARILPVFETTAPKYAWLNSVVAVGVYRPTPGKVAYRIYRIL
jgi:hypothetical protein